ncbi:MAG: GNAT family N-acetyltransferase [Alphaproteobacteria bacterium]
MSASKLIKPALDHKESFLEALREYHEEGRYSFLDEREIDENYEAFIKDLNEGNRHIHKPYADWVEPVKETALWLVKEDKYIGALNIRHRLNWHLEKWGGHMNFIIRPSMRGKGFGKKILQKGMPIANYLGIDRALLTVSPNNPEVIKAIEFCGGTYEDTLPATEQFPARKRYWLDCT